MKQEVCDVFKYYLGLHKYHYGMKQSSLTVDMPSIQESLYQYLLKQENVKFHLDSEITSIEKDKTLKGNVGIIRSGYGGSKSIVLKCDAVVMCNSWKTSSMLKRHLSYSVPVIPLK